MSVRQAIITLIAAWLSAWLLHSNEESLTGVVLDDTGAAIDEATISVFYKNRPTPEGLRAISNKDGAFTIPGIRGTARHWKIHITKLGFLPLSLDGWAPTNQSFRLVRGELLDVRVASSVRIAKIQYTASTRVGDGWRQAAGSLLATDVIAKLPHQWIITVPNCNSLDLAVYSDEGVGYSLRQINPPAAAGDPAIINTPIDPESNTAETVCTAAGLPYAHAPVTLQLNGAGGIATKRIIPLKTGSDGQLAFKTQAGRSYAIHATEPGWVIADEGPPPLPKPRGGSDPESRPGLRATARFVAYRDSVIFGQLTFAGEPPAEPVPIRIFRIRKQEGNTHIDLTTEVVSGNGGRYECRGLAPGRYAIVPARATDDTITSLDPEAKWPDINTIPWKHGVSIEQEGSTVSFDLQLPFSQPRRVAGCVYIFGAPMAGARVVLERRDGLGHEVSASTDEDGMYHIPVARAGPYRLLVYDNNNETIETRNITLEDNQSRHVNFDITPTVITGVIRIENGAAAQVRVALQATHSRSAEDLWEPALEDVPTDAHGRFRQIAPRAGQYRLFIFDPRHRHASIATKSFLVKGGEPVTLDPIVAPPARPIHISASEISGSPAAGRIWIGAADGEPPLPALVQAWLFPTKEGIVIHGLAPGKYKIRLLPFEDIGFELRPGSEPERIIFTKLQPGTNNNINTRDSAYFWRERAEEKNWAWGGEPPFLYTQEEWREYESGRR